MNRAFADGGCCHAVGYIVGVAKNKQLNAMTAQRQREAQDCYAALCTKLRWFTETHYAAGNWDRKRSAIAHINNDLTSGKGPIADIERLNSYFRNVLETVIPGSDAGRRQSILVGSSAFQPA